MTTKLEMTSLSLTTLHKNIRRLIKALFDNKVFTNGKVNFKNGATKITYNILHIKPYKADNKIEDFNSINMFYGVKL